MHFSNHIFFSNSVMLSAINTMSSACNISCNIPSLISFVTTSTKYQLVDNGPVVNKTSIGRQRSSGQQNINWSTTVQWSTKHQLADNGPVVNKISIGRQRSSGQQNINWPSTVQWSTKHQLVDNGPVVNKTSIGRQRSSGQQNINWSTTVQWSTKHQLADNGPVVNKISCLDFMFMLDQWSTTVSEMSYTFVIHWLKTSHLITILHQW